MSVAGKETRLKSRDAHIFRGLTVEGKPVKETIHESQWQEKGREMLLNPNESMWTITEKRPEDLATHRSLLMITRAVSWAGPAEEGSNL